MKGIEINPAGHFENWTRTKLLQLKEEIVTTQVGEQLLFEDHMIKVWSIELAPGKRLPFHKHTTNYNWTCLTAGSATSHYETGRIVAINYVKGDESYYDFDSKGAFIHDLENTGTQTLQFITVEFL
ncbi:MAG: hypothetical protein ACSHWW_06380 [Nonlabens sp.]|uniref:hypothetical protein n=1 Tax=Nonlabens sp. TaxID=1888209 RepID=UPI003EF67205